MRTIFTIYLMLVADLLFAQFPNISSAPQPATFQRYDDFHNTPSSPANVNRQIKTGVTAFDGNRRQQPSSLPNAVADQQKMERERRVYEQTMKELTADLNRMDRQRLINSALDTTFGNPPVMDRDRYEATKLFWDALVVLTDMGSGKRRFSITEAIYMVENAYLHNQLSKERFYRSIQARADLCRQIMQREQLNHNDNIAKNYAIQKLYQQSNIYNDPKTGATIKVPKMEYDFTDYMADSSHAQMFVSKLITSGKGQCHSMPLMFLAIAEQLGAKANLSLAPEHSFIRFSDGDGGMYNFESTNGYIVSDNWMLQSGYISTTAIKNKIYLDTLSQKQLLAFCMFDLAMGYEYDNGYDAFTEQVLKYALPLAPNSVQGHMMCANFWAAKTKKAIDYFNIPSPEALQHHPVAATLQKRMLQEYEVIESLGYQHMPEVAYQAWLRSVNAQKEKQERRQLQQQLQYQLKNSTINITPPIKKY